jgi:hypothetical protein
MELRKVLAVVVDSCATLGGKSGTFFLAQSQSVLMNKRCNDYLTLEVQVD